MVSAVTPAAILRATWTETGVAVLVVACIVVGMAIAKMTAMAIRRLTCKVICEMILKVTSTATWSRVADAVRERERARNPVLGQKRGSRTEVRLL